MTNFSQSRNNKLLYYLSGHFKRLYPKSLLTLDLDKLQQSIDSFDEDKMYSRLNYYNKINSKFALDESTEMIKEISGMHGTYSLDLMEYTRFFSQDNRLSYLFGDITEVPNIPSVTKSRPVVDNDNSILMKFDKVRHFYFVNNDIPFKDKENKLVWRGAAHQPHRKDFLNNFYKKSKLIDVGGFHKNPKNDDLYQAPFLTIQQQLQSKFILSIEGNDVATSTKWTMSSNSLCFMTKPKYETWLMEGRLIPGHHYVLLKDDYSDLEEKIEYYIDHEDEAENIIQNANLYINQFKDNKSEDWLSLKVLEKYFILSSQI